MKSKTFKSVINQVTAMHDFNYQIFSMIGGKIIQKTFPKGMKSRTTSDRIKEHSRLVDHLKCSIFSIQMLIPNKKMAEHMATDTINVGCDLLSPPLHSIEGNMSVLSADGHVNNNIDNNSSTSPFICKR